MLPISYVKRLLEKLQNVALNVKYHYHMKASLFHNLKSSTNILSDYDYAMTQEFKRQSPKRVKLIRQKISG